MKRIIILTLIGLLFFCIWYNFICIYRYFSSAYDRAVRLIHLQLPNFVPFGVVILMWDTIFATIIIATRKIANEKINEVVTGYLSVVILILMTFGSYVFSIQTVMLALFMLLLSQLTRYSYAFVRLFTDTVVLIICVTLMNILGDKVPINIGTIILAVMLGLPYKLYDKIDYIHQNHNIINRKYL